ncbi:hypothetical protein Hanom_Chr16g01415131 [Helianthus anomalus]
MGNSAGQSPCPEIIGIVGEVNGDHFQQPPSGVIEEREDLGQGYNCLNEVGEKGSPNSERPSYITVRPKQRMVEKGPVIVDPLPDLNEDAVDSLGSDPFNIEEIFRKEREVNHGETCGRAMGDVEAASTGVEGSFARAAPADEVDNNDEDLV